VTKSVPMIVVLGSSLALLAGCYKETYRASKSIELDDESAAASRPAPPPADLETAQEAPTTAPTPMEAPPATAAPTPTSEAPPTAAIAAPDQKTRVVMETNLGEMVVELWPDIAPLTVANFLRLVESGFYENMAFNRMIPGFMIQLGKLADTTKASQIKPIRGEFNETVKHGEGTISMARQPSDVNSATYQFFICFRPNSEIEERGLASLDGKWAIFGKVVEGLDVLRKIGSIPTTTQQVGGRDERSKPTQPILLRTIRIVR